MDVKIRGSHSRSRSPRERKQSKAKSSRSRQKSPSPEAKSHKHRSRSKDRRQSPLKSKSHKKRSHSRDGSRHSHSQDKNHKRRSTSKERRNSPRQKSRSKSREKRRSPSPIRVKRRSRSPSRDKIRKRSTRSRSKDRKSSPDRKHSSRSRNSKERKHKGKESPERRYRRSRSRSLTPKRRGNESKSSFGKYSQDGLKPKLVVKGPEKAKPGALPLNPTIGGLPAGQAITPQLLLQQTMAAVNAQAAGLTNVPLPKYYNPAAVNPLKYAEQMQKRKLLWHGTKPKEEQPPVSSNCWEKTTFMEDQDGKLTAKFRKLMGIKKESADGTSESVSEGTEPDQNILKQEALFKDLDQQYEMARISTHTQRGVGLGYSAYPALIFPK